jgi:hypothetical protein
MHPNGDFQNLVGVDIISFSSHHPGPTRAVPGQALQFQPLVCAAVCAHTDPSIDGAKDKDTGRWRSGDVDERPQQRTCRSREPPLLSRVFSRRRQRPRSTGGPRSDGPTTPRASYIHTAPPPGRSLQTCSEAKQETRREREKTFASSLLPLLLPAVHTTSQLLLSQRRETPSDLPRRDGGAAQPPSSPSGKRACVVDPSPPPPPLPAFLPPRFRS